MRPRDYPAPASAAPLNFEAAALRFRLLLAAQNRFDATRLPQVWIDEIVDCAYKEESPK